MSETNARRKPGGQPGNLNRAKSALPALKRLEVGKPLPAYLERVAALADLEAGELISDKGGEAYMSGAEKLMVANWKSARMAELLIWHYLLRTEAAVQVNKQNNVWDLQPGIARLSVFLAEQRRCLVTLGMERRSRPAEDLQTYLAREYGPEED
ncbi:hypothetical protein MYX84_00775 [Acidobacteria bacterium AH-259-O06]|nr:hypothetical protein [Acidobacteria bacterium AH-259-O06]